MTQPSPADLITLTDVGFYCEAGDFYIDPWAPVPRSINTHAHGDHIAWNCGSYLVAYEGLPVFRIRLGHEAHIETLAWGEVRDVNGVRVSLHPAGHILGSAQVRVEHGGEVWVISGDYKTEVDRTCSSFQPVRCHTFISEATFALPIYHWRPQDEIFADINDWWRGNADEGRASVVYAYALGKSQRVLGGLDGTVGPIYTHGATERITHAYRDAGIDLPPTTYVTRYMEAQKEAGSKPDWAGSLIVAPLSARGTSWTRKFGNYASSFVSGWMQIRGARRRRAVDRGFVMSDHADWEGLLGAIAATGAERIGVTHGYVPVFVRYLRDQGYDARGYSTRYTDESESNEDVSGEEES